MSSKSILRELHKNAIELYERGDYYSSLVLAYQFISLYTRKYQTLLNNENINVNEVKRKLEEALRNGSIDIEFMDKLISYLREVFTEEEKSVIVNIDLIDVLLGIGLLISILLFFIKFDILWIDLIRFPLVSLFLVMIAKKILVQRKLAQLAKLEAKSD